MFKFAATKGLMTTDNIGSVWTYSLNLVKELRKHDYEITLAITGDKLTEAQKIELGDIPWYFGRYRQEWMEDPWDDIRLSGEWLMDIKDRVAPDFIHLNSYSIANLRWRIPVVVTLHSCMLSWWEAVKHEQAPKEWFRYKGQVENGIRSADVVVAPSLSMLLIAQKYYGIIGNNKVIYNGGNRMNYTPGIKEKYIFSIGSALNEAENIDLIIRAAPYIPYNIYIAGDNSGYTKHTLPPNVNFTGPLSHEKVRGWLSAASVYLLPVKYEPFGFTFLEAAFSGCAIVTGDIPSMHEIWEDAAVYANPDDPWRLADTVNALMYDDDMRTTLARKATQRAESKFTIEKMAEDYRNLYRQFKRERLKIII